MASKGWGAWNDWQNVLSLWRDMKRYTVNKMMWLYIMIYYEHVDYLWYALFSLIVHMSVHAYKRWDTSKILPLNDLVETDSVSRSKRHKSLPSGHGWLGRALITCSFLLFFYFTTLLVVIILLFDFRCSFQGKTLALPSYYWNGWMKHQQKCNNFHLFHSLTSSKTGKANLKALSKKTCHWAPKKSY